MSPRQASATSRSGLRGQPMQRGVEELWYRAARLRFPIPGVREFQKRYDAAVPELPLADVEGLVSRKAPWSEMVELIHAAGPHGLVIYSRNDVPLHTVIWEDADGSAWFTADQPSTQFASFDNPDIAQVGIELDPQARRRAGHERPDAVSVFSAARRL
jgi:hypothetical protein